MDELIWTGRGKVRAREAAGELIIVVDGLTSQAKYYKPLIYEFFRKEWRGARPAWIPWWRCGTSDSGECLHRHPALFRWLV